MAQFIVSQAEAIEMIRRQFMLPTTVEVIIEQTTEPNVEDDGWIDVPADWTENEAPPAAGAFTSIQVEFSDGDMGDGSPDEWCGSWSRSNFYRNIIKFRPIK